MYVIRVNGKAVDEAPDFWKAYQKASRLRDAGFEPVRVYLDGDWRQGPVFALVRSPRGDPETDRVDNTVDPAAWDGVLALVLKGPDDEG